MIVKRRGFTLIEVLIALGIAGGALVLLMSANHAAMRRTMRAYQNSQLEEVIESKSAEIRAGIETGPNGTFEQISGWTWSVSRAPAQIEGLTTLDEVTIKILSPGASASAARTVTFLQRVPRIEKK